MKFLIFMAMLLPSISLAQRYPSGGNASVGVTGSPVPLSADLAGSENPSGNLMNLQSDASGNLYVNINGSGGGVLVNTNLQQVGGAAITLGQKTLANGIPVSLASDQILAVSQSGTWNINNISGTISLPTGAATSALQTSGNASLTSIDGKIVTVDTGNVTVVSSALPSGASTSAKQPALGTAGTPSADVISVQGHSGMTPLVVDGSGGSFPISGMVTANQGTPGVGAWPVLAAQSGTWNITNISGTVSLPTGASTETTVAAINAKFGSLGQKTMSGSAPVVLASDQSAIPVSQSGTWTFQPGNTPNTTAWLVTQAGRAKANAPVRNDYSSSPITTSAYVQLVASTTSAASVICVFDSSGQDLVFATGAAASEVNQIEIFPGGNGCEPLAIAASTRLSVKAVSASATSGVLIINLYQ